MKFLRLFLPVLAFSAVVSFSCRAGDILLNEIMYLPPGGNVFEEYVELYNRGTNTVDLNGWRFTRGFEYALTGVTLAPDGYLVIAADLPTFQAK